MCQPLSGLEVEMAPQAIFEKLTEIVLFARALLDKQLQIITHTALCEHANALGDNNPRTLYPPSLQECRHRRHFDAGSGCKSLGEIRIVVRTESYFC